MIELKLFWSGQVRSFIEPKVKDDASKLKSCLKDGSTVEAFQVILDGLDRKGVPYLDEDHLHRLKKGTKLTIFHWPDSAEPIEDFEHAEPGVY